MKKAHSHTSLSNVHSETQKLRRQNAYVLLSQSFRCLLSHVIVEFPNSIHMYALGTYFSFLRAKAPSTIFLSQCVHLGPVHTNPFSNENGAVLFRFQKDLCPHLSFSPVHTATLIKRDASW